MSTRPTALGVSCMLLAAAIAGCSREAGQRPAGPATAPVATAPTQAPATEPTTTATAETPTTATADAYLEQLLSELKSKDWRTREAAARALGRSKDPGAIKALKLTAAADVVMVRIEAIESLARIGGDEARDWLVEQLKDPNPAVRRAAIEALGNRGDGGGVLDLADGLADPDEAAMVAQAIRAMASEAGAGPVLPPTTLPARAAGMPPYLETFEETLKRIHAAAAKGEPGAADRIIELWEYSNSSERPKVVEAMTDLSGPQVIAFFSMTAWSTDPKVREQAVDYLIKADDKAVGPLVAIAVSRPPWLPKSPKDPFGIPFHGCQEDSSDEDRARAGKAVVKIARPAVKPLTEAFRSGDREQRALAASLLGQIARAENAGELADEIVAIFVADADDKDAWVRYKAEEALVRIGEPAAKAIAPWIDDISPAKRETGVELLSLIGGDKAVKALIVALADEHWAVRRRTAWGLGRLGDRRAVEPLKRLAANDPEERVKLAAAAALKEFAETQPAAP